MMSTSGFFRSFVLLAPLGLLLVVVGCGGRSSRSDSSNTGGTGGTTSGTSALNFATSADYNGIATTLQNPTSTAADAGGKTTVNLTSAGRTVAVTLPSTLTPGSFDLATSGAVARYTEANRAGGGTWKTDAGTVTVVASGTNKYDVKLTNAHFTVDGTLQGNPATGDFTMTGTAYGVPYTISVGPGGVGSFTVSNNTSGIDPTFTPNYYLKSVVSGYIAAGATRLEGQTTTNFLSVYVEDKSADQPLGGNLLVHSTLSVGTGTTAKSYEAKSGSIEVVKTGSKHKFILKNVAYEADGGNSTGGFTLNGSFEK